MPTMALKWNMSPPVNVYQSSDNYPRVKRVLDLARAQRFVGAIATLFSNLIFCRIVVDIICKKVHS